MGFFPINFLALGGRDDRRGLKKTGWKDREIFDEALVIPRQQPTMHPSSNPSPFSQVPKNFLIPPSSLQFS